MKRATIIITLLFVFVVETKAQKERLFPVKSGMIKYKFQDRAGGVETVFFDDYGKKFLSVKTFDNDNETSVKIIKHQKLIVLNGNSKQADIYTENDSKTALRKIVSDGMLNAMGFKAGEKEAVAGKTCLKYTGDNGKYWIWENVVLKSETEVMGIKINYEAVEIKTGIDIPGEKFEIPKGYRIVEKDG